MGPCKWRLLIRICGEGGGGVLSGMQGKSVVSRSVCAIGNNGNYQQIE